MKLSRPTLWLLLLNVAWLATATWYLARHFRNAAAEPRVQVITNYVPVFKTSAPRAVPPAVTVVTNVVATNDFRWAQLESEDYRSYIERLRAIGCPEQTIRDIVIADVDKMLAPRMQAASSRPRELHYWQSAEQELWAGGESQEALRKQRAVDYEKREVIRQLLGVDLVGERLRVQGQDDYHGQRLGFLPEDKRAQVRTVLDQFADQEREFVEQQIEEGNGVVDAGELDRLRRQKDEALAPLLTPDERQQYDLWFSDSAARVRDSLFGLESNEEEFLKLYALQKDFETRTGDAPTPGTAHWNDFQAKVREALGEQRHAEWLRAQDPEYREIVKVASRFKIPTAVATELYGYKQPIEEERARVEADPNLTPQQKEAAYQAIAAETQKIYQQALGEKAYRHLSKRTSNRWLRSGR